jgi:hypothetical protein
MADTTKPLRALLPHATEEELQVSNDWLDRYLTLAIEIASAAHRTGSTTVLTESNEGGTVIAGQVDPRTFTNTG